MTNPVIRYPLDGTGISPNNFVNNEPHTLQPLRIRALAPTYGAYFTESLRIYDNSTNTRLTNTQYICTELATTPSQTYAKEICYLVLIIDPTVSNNVTISYQALGGPYNNNADAIIQIYNLLNLDTTPVVWSNITHPTVFPPEPHLHDIGDVYGFEYVVEALERVRNALLLADSPGFENLLRWLTSQLASMQQTMDARLNVLQSADRVTKAQIGLGSVENYAPATTAQTILGASTSTLTTPYGVAAAIRSAMDNSGVRTISSDISAAIDSHTNAIDPHTQYKQRKDITEITTAITANTATTVLDLSPAIGASTFIVTISANTALSFINPPNGFCSFGIITKNDSIANRALAFPSGIQWAGGIIPPRTTTANAKDIWWISRENEFSPWVGSLSVNDAR
jgi:hypothetical protein